MADFEAAFQFMIKHEGGYVNDPADAGGETKYGISKRSYPNLDIASLSLDQAKAVYLRDFWKAEYAQIADQALANKVFDMAVNMGFHQAHKELQRAINACAGDNTVECDGKFGPATSAAVQQLDPTQLRIAMCDQCVLFYHNLIQAKPSNKKFERNWINRARA